MADNKRQTVMLGVLGVLVLGAGSTYWFVLRDTGPQTMKLKEGPSSTEKKKRRSSEDDDKSKKKKKTRDRTEAKAERVERKTRDRSDREKKKTTKKRRSRGGRKIEKKKKELPPAAWMPPQEDWFEELEIQDFRPPSFA